MSKITEHATGVLTSNRTIPKMVREAMSELIEENIALNFKVSELTRRIAELNKIVNQLIHEDNEGRTTL